MRSFPDIKNPNSVYENIYVFDQNGINNRRVSYNLIDFIGDISGVYDLMIMTLGIFVNSIAYHSFTLKAIKKMFLVKTDDFHLLDEKKRCREKDNCEKCERKIKLKGIAKYLSPQVTDCLKNDQFKTEVLRSHRIFQVSTNQSFMLFWQAAWNRFFSKWKPIRNKLLTLHTFGTSRILKSFDIVKICNDIKFLKLHAKFKHYPSQKTKF